MAEQMGQGSILERLLGRSGQAAWEKVRGNEVTYGYASLPPGIIGGVAQLVSAKVGVGKPGTKNANKPFAFFQGTAILPLQHQGIPVQGKLVNQTIYLCDLPDRKRQDGTHFTLEDQLDTLRNEIGKFETGTANLNLRDIEPILAELTKRKPKFTFSTRGYTPPATTANPKPTEMVFISFDGLYQEGEGESLTDQSAYEMKDNSGGGGQEQEVMEITESDVGSVPSNIAERPLLNPENPGQVEAVVRGAIIESERDLPDSECVNQQVLREHALKNGWTDDDINDAEDWSAVGKMVTSQKNPPKEETPPPESSQSTESKNGFVPNVGDPVHYEKVDPKSPKNKPRIKTIEVEVVSVDPGKGTANLKDLSNPTTVYKDIPFSRIKEIAF